MRVVLVAWPAGELERAAMERAAIAIEASGHDLTTIDLLASEFRATMPVEERSEYHDENSASTAVRPSVDAVRAADALVFVYPDMATGVPPVMRGWLERVMLPGVAFVFDAQGRVKPGLTNVRAIVGIATYRHGWARVKWSHDAGRRIVLRALRLNTGLRTRTRWVAAYHAPSFDAVARTRFLARVETAVTSW